MATLPHPLELKGSCILIGDDDPVATIDAGGATLEIDAENYRQVIGDLSGKTVKYSSLGSIIRVGLENRDGHHISAVVDQQPGNQGSFEQRGSHGGYPPESCPVH